MSPVVGWRSTEDLRSRDATLAAVHAAMARRQWALRELRDMLRALSEENDALRRAAAERDNEKRRAEAALSAAQQDRDNLSVHAIYERYQELLM